MHRIEAQKVPFFFIFIPIFVGLVLATSRVPYIAYNYDGGWDYLVADYPL